MASGDVGSNIWRALPRKVVVLDGLAVGRGRQARERHGGGQELHRAAQDPGVDGRVHAHRQVRAVLLDRRHLAQCAAGDGGAGERAFSGSCVFLGRHGRTCGIPGSIP